jgi:hypothetical protein
MPVFPLCSFVSFAVKVPGFSDHPISFDLTFVSCSPWYLPMEKARENGILVIAASIIAVIRLRGAPIERSPKVVFTISESVQLARMVLDEVERRG